MMTADKLAELYKAVLILEEKLEMAKTRLREAQKFDPGIVNDGKKQVELARNALASAQKEFSNGITSFNRIYSNVPFYRFSNIQSSSRLRRCVSASISTACQLSFKTALVMTVSS